MQVVPVAFQHELLLSLQDLNLLRFLHRCATLLYFLTFLRIAFANFVRGNDINEDLTKGCNGLQHDIDVFWVLAEREQVTQLAIAVGWEADDLCFDSLHDANLLAKGHFSHELRCNLLTIGGLLLLFDGHLFQLLVRGAKSLIFRYGLLSSDLTNTILSRLLDHSPVCLLLLAPIVTSLLTERLHFTFFIYLNTPK